MNEEQIKQMVNEQTKGLLIEIAAWETIIQSLPELHRQMVENMKAKAGNE